MNDDELYYKEQIDILEYKIDELEGLLKEIKEYCVEQTTLTTLDRLYGGEFTGSYVTANTILQKINKYEKG